jgi:AcrR family transcriptional regulator
MADSCRRSQAERRATSRQAVLASACRLFGEKGYSETSLEEIAADCGLTARPIYHYFGNKKALFAAVNECMEARIAAAVVNEPGSAAEAGIVENWRAFLALCRDPGFRRIVLVDSRNVLGTDRWATSAQDGDAAGPAGAGQDSGQEAARFRAALLNRVVMSAFVDAALMIVSADHPAMAEREAEALMVALFSRLRGHLSVPVPIASESPADGR